MKRALLFAFAAALVCSACNPQPQHAAGTTPTPSAAPSAIPPLDIRCHGTRTRPVSISQLSGNRKAYQMLAQSCESHSAQNLAQANFQQTAVTFFDKDGTRLQATAPAATITKDKKVILSGGVRATTSSGLHLTCNRLTYDQSTSMLHGEGNVRIAGMQGGQQELLTGNTFTSDVKLTQMVIQ